MLKLTILGLCLISASHAAYASNAKITGEPNTKPDSFEINIGTFYANSDSYMLVSEPETNRNLSVDFENDLKLDEKQFLPFFEFIYHFNDRHNLYLDWKSLHRNAHTPSLEKAFQVTIDDINYDVKAGGELKTTLNIDILRLGYGYDFWEGSNYTMGLSVGLHTMFVRTEFKGTIGICAPNSTSENLCDSIIATPDIIDDNLTAPLLDVGFYGRYDFSPRWSFSAHAQYFDVNYNDVDGALIDVRVALEARIADRWFLTVGYNFYDVDVDIAQTGKDEQYHIADYNVHYSFTGPMLFVSYQF